jgi:AraC family transcriptional regulator
MNPRIEILKEKKLVGKRMSMSFTDYRMGELWGSFMPRKKEIAHLMSNDLISMVVYSPAHFLDFKPTNVFERWATVEVANFDQAPEGMETFVLPSGLYAVFHYTGSVIGIAHFYQQIYSVWLPNSEYELDDRPHFEVLGDKYKNNDPSSEEDIWIPIKAKSL